MYGVFCYTRYNYMPQYRPTIGLEIHAELKTQTKMFCGCRNNPDETTPNTNICPVCMAHPGTLPVINREAVRKVLLVGTALGSKLADFTEFDRKSYFYPDIPKGYQISQYKYPLVEGGALRGVEITRIHLEEDTARSNHEGEKTLVDYNRAGVPLMELVTEPVIHDAETAGAFARELQLILRTLGAGEANMEKGEMRVEANISVSKNDTFGTKVEVKNLNSFRSMERAVAYEVARQIELLESGGEVVQETRGWDEEKQVTFSQRKKESSHDYRYFPDPDLPKLRISEIPEFSRESLSAMLPELPAVRRARYTSLGLKETDAELFTRDAVLGGFFEKFLECAQADTLGYGANYIASDIAGKLQTGEVSTSWLSLKENAERFAALMSMLKANQLSSRGAKDVLTLMCASTDTPETLAREHSLLQESGEEKIKEIVANVLSANENMALEYKSGKISVLQFFVGQGMKLSKGSANPTLLTEHFKKALE